MAAESGAKLVQSSTFTSLPAQTQTAINLLHKHVAPEHGPMVSAPQETGKYELISHTQAWKDLARHATEEIANTHLRTLIADAKRDASLTVEHDNLLLDYSRQRVTLKTMDLLFNLAETANVRGKIKAFAAGEKVNGTEGRAAGHMALRAAADTKVTSYTIDGKNVAPDVQRVLAKIKSFAETVRTAEWKGATGKALTDIVAIGIGGSYLGAEYVYEALKMDGVASRNARGRSLRFLANVDPVGVARALDGINPDTTLVIVISKTFTTAETMLNARTCRDWITSALGAAAIPKHMIAVSTNVPEVTKFGIDPNNIFEFWDWVGGRYSVCSAVGLVPLALHFGYDVVDAFLAGARSIDSNFVNAQPRSNVALILGLIGVWNSSFLGYPTRSIAAYSQALNRLAPHIQQVDMESNGKRVTTGGVVLDFDAGEINFGEPGTNSQHSYFQLFHQGRVTPVDFIGFVESQRPVELKGEPVANHDELMANFFAQPDALAVGKTADELRAEGVKELLIPHMTFGGNRPSSSLLLPRLTAFEAGQLLALYEHRTVVQGFVWGINSFDQFGVELGKVLASHVRKTFTALRKVKAPLTPANAAAALAPAPAAAAAAPATPEKADGKAAAVAADAKSAAPATAAAPSAVGTGAASAAANAQAVLPAFNPSTAAMLLRYLNPPAAASKL